MFYVLLGKAPQRIRDTEQGGSKERRGRERKRKKSFSCVRPGSLKSVRKREKGGKRDQGNEPGTWRERKERTGRREEGTNGQQQGNSETDSGRVESQREL